MKKKILGLAFIAMSLVTFNGMAQTTTSNENATAKQEKVKGKKSDRKEREARFNPFEGMNLTDAQKSQLEQLKEQRKEARKEARKQQAQAKKEKRHQKAEARINAKKKYLEDVKAIVGHEQYVVFLENMYINGGKHHGAAKGKAFKHGKDGKRKMGKMARADKMKAKANRRHNNRTTESNSQS